MLVRIEKHNKYYLLPISRYQNSCFICWLQRYWRWNKWIFYKRIYRRYRGSSQIYWASLGHWRSRCSRRYCWSTRKSPCVRLEIRNKICCAYLWCSLSRKTVSLLCRWLSYGWSPVTCARKACEWASRDRCRYLRNSYNKPM